MVELVLHRPRREPFEVVGDLLPTLVSTLDANPDGTFDGNEHALQRQTTLVFRLELLAAPDELGVDERCDFVVLAAGVEHEDALQDSDLRRRETDAARVDHQRPHPFDEPPQVVVELLHGVRLQAQRGVWVLADLSERDPAPCLALGVELLLANLSLDLGHDGHTIRVDRREREAIMRQGVHRAETPRDRAEREALEVDLLDSPVTGKPLRRRLRNFRPGADTTLQALGGPLAWMRRLRAIELAVAEHEARLGGAWTELRDLHVNDEEFARAWRELADGWSFRYVNELIERHNRYFPAEARLPMNPRTGDFVPVNGRPYRREKLDAHWILERFPAP